MALDWYDTGTISIAPGSKILTGSGTFWAAPGRVFPGDKILPADGSSIGIVDSVEGHGTITLKFGWVGNELVDAEYVIEPSSTLRRETDRAAGWLSEYREMQEALQLVAVSGSNPPPAGWGEEAQWAMTVTASGLALYENVVGQWVARDVEGRLGVSAIGTFAGRDAYDDQASPVDGVYFTYLSIDGDGDTITDAVMFVKLSGASGDWSAPILLRGPGGRILELQQSATHIQWRNQGDVVWNDLVPLADIAGTDGREVELQKGATHIQWRYAGDVAWIDLISLDGLQGDEVELQVTATHIQWRLGTSVWADLIALTDLEGAQGPQGFGIQPDDTGTLVERDAHDGAVKGFVYLQTDVTPNVLFVKRSAASGDWSGPTPLGGGDVLKSNNLADLADAATARSNLGLGDLATRDQGDLTDPVAMAIVFGG